MSGRDISADLNAGKYDFTKLFKVKKCKIPNTCCSFGGSGKDGIKYPIYSWFASPKYYQSCTRCARPQCCKTKCWYFDYNQLCASAAKEKEDENKEKEGEPEAQEGNAETGVSDKDKEQGLRRRLSTNTLHGMRSVGDLRAWSLCNEDQRRYFLEKMQMKGGSADRTAELSAADGDEEGTSTMEAQYESLLKLKDDEIERLKDRIRELEGQPQRPSPSSFRPSPEENELETKTSHASGSMELDIQFAEQPPGSVLDDEMSEHTTFKEDPEKSLPTEASETPSQPHAVTSETDVSKPDSSKSVIFQSDESKEDSSMADTTQPDESKADSSMEETTQPEESKADAIQPNESKEDSSKSDTTQPEDSDKSQVDESQAGESQGAESKAGESEAEESQAAESQAEESQAAESQAEESQAAESQAEESQAAESQAEESQVEESQAEESQVEESQAEESQVAESQAGESKADESQSEVLQAEESQGGESKADESQSEESKTDESQAEESKSDESQAEESKADESQAEELQADESQAEELQAAESQAEESQAAESQAEESQAEESQAAEAQAEESQGAEVQVEESQAAEALAGESEVAESQGGESEAAKSQGGESEAAESQGGESEAAESQGGETQAADSKGDESQADKSGASGSAELNETPVGVTESMESIFADKPSDDSTAKEGAEKSLPSEPKSDEESESEGVRTHASGCMELDISFLEPEQLPTEESSGLAAESSQSQQPKRPRSLSLAEIGGYEERRRKPFKCSCTNHRKTSRPQAKPSIPVEQVSKSATDFDWGTLADPYGSRIVVENNRIFKMRGSQVVEELDPSVMALESLVLQDLIMAQSDKIRELEEYLYSGYVQTSAVEQNQIAILRQQVLELEAELADKENLATQWYRSLEETTEERNRYRDESQRYQIQVDEYKNVVAQMQNRLREMESWARGQLVTAQQPQHAVYASNYATPEDRSGGKGDMFGNIPCQRK